MHTRTGSGEAQANEPDSYNEKIDSEQFEKKRNRVIPEDPVTGFDIDKRPLTIGKPLCYQGNGAFVGPVEKVVVVRTVI
jgi:hypothetical protein